MRIHLGSRVNLATTVAVSAALANTKTQVQFPCIGFEQEVAQLQGQRLADLSRRRARSRNTHRGKRGRRIST